MDPDNERTKHEPSVSTALESVAATWDVVIIGAGPAGAVAASVLAEKGKRVLLVEKSPWPREKVCGGCLNDVAVRVLSNVGLDLSLRGGQPISHVVWHSRRKSTEMAARGGMAILRSELDAGLVDCAIARGGAFLSGTMARILPADSDEAHRVIELMNGGVIKNIRAKVVLACDGVAGKSADGEPWATWRLARRAWMGAAVTCMDHGFELRSGAIHMHIGPGGYVGAVRMDGGKVHLAAAFDPAECRRAGGPAMLIEKILRSCGQRNIPDLKTLRFHGAGAMTRRREQLGGHRVLAVGDACGYVEPFTGEGIAWAIRSAVAVANLLLAAGDWQDDLAARWGVIHHTLIERRQRWCKALRPVVHHPWLAGVGIAGAHAVPAIGNFLSRQICESDLQIPAHRQGAIG